MADIEKTSNRVPNEEECKLFWNLVSENSEFVNEGLPKYIKHLFPNDPHTVDVIFRDTMNTALAKIYTLERREAFCAWMLRIAENKIKGLWRSQKKHRKIFRKLSEDPTCRPRESSDTMSPDEKIIREEEITIAYKILHSLPEDIKEYYVLHIFGGLKVADLAKELNVSERTVYRRLEEAEGLLRERGQEFLSIVPLTLFEIRSSLHPSLAKMARSPLIPRSRQTSSRCKSARRPTMP